MGFAPMPKPLRLVGVCCDGLDANDYLWLVVGSFCSSSQLDDWAHSEVYVDGIYGQKVAASQSKMEISHNMR